MNQPTPTPVIKKSEPKILDSGKRQSFSTGAVRDTQDDKGDLSLLPYYSILELAKHFQRGARKYDKNNFRKGIPLSRYFDSCQRHLAKYAMGWEDEDHLISACWNLVALIETKKRIEMGQLPQELNDFPYVQMEEKEETSAK